MTLEEKKEMFLSLDVIEQTRFMEDFESDEEIKKFLSLFSNDEKDRIHDRFMAHQDWIDNSIYHLCMQLSDQTLEWDIERIGRIRAEIEGYVGLLYPYLEEWETE